MQRYVRIGECGAGKDKWKKMKRECEFAENLPITYLLGDAGKCFHMRDQQPMEPFAERTIGFLSSISENLRREGRKQGMSDVMAFAFWCRRVHLEQMKKKYLRENEMRLGRGVSLHFAPGNIPVQFAFTAAAGLLAGNCVIVRLPGKRTPQEQTIIGAFRELLEGDFSDFQGRVVFCRYGHEPEVTEALSRLCDVRVIWGSDESVYQIRKALLSPGAVELPFPARDSAAVLNAGEVLLAPDIDRLCEDFYNDTYLNDQNACSSPHVICWVGAPEIVPAAQKRFWEGMERKLAQKEWKVQPTVAVRKLDAALRMAAEFEDVHITWKDSSIVRVAVSELDDGMWSYMEPGGFFVEKTGESYSALLPVLSGRCQTLSVYGIPAKELAAYLVQQRVSGVDRIVPVGHTLDFDLTWDGFDLIEHMSRQIYMM